MKVSVLLPVFNGMPYVPRAVQSVLGQTVGDFELIVVDDGSTDGSAEALAEIRDSRVAMVRTAHRGLIPALQEAARRARAPYLARMDADDVSYPDRFAEQLRLLGARPELAVVGCGAALIDPDGRTKGTFWPPLSNDSFLDLAACNPLIHGSVMMRRSEFERAGGYQEAPEDYALWIRLARQGRGLGCVEKLLYEFREHPSRYSLTHRRSQSAGILQVQLPLLQECMRTRDRRAPLVRDRLLTGWGRVAAAALICDRQRLADRAVRHVFELHRAGRTMEIRSPRRGDLAGARVAPGAKATSSIRATFLRRGRTPFDETADLLIWAGCPPHVALRLRLHQWAADPLSRNRIRDLALCVPGVDWLRCMRPTARR